MSHLSLRPIENKSRTATKILANAQITKAKTKKAVTTSTSLHSKFKSLQKIKIESIKQNSVYNAQATCKGLSSKSLLQLKELVPSSTLPFEAKEVLVVEKEKVASLSFDPLQHRRLDKPTAIIDRKRRRKRKHPRSCSSDIEKIEADGGTKPMLRTDVEVFQGKIVFNLDGNAFIIASENSTQDLIVNATKTTVAPSVTANEGGGKVTAKSSAVAKKSIKTPLGTTSTLEGASSSRDGEQRSTPKSTNFLKTTTSPRIHSFRIVSAQDATASTTAATIKISTEQQTQERHRRSDNNDNDSGRTNDNNIGQRSSKIQKPILMCFICKLSFGNTKSFSSHASSEHQLTLQPKEHHLLNREYSSAIIQPPNMDNSPQISFLEPIDMLSVMKSNDLNIETDVQFDEGTPHPKPCELDSGETSEKSCTERICEKVADTKATTRETSSMITSTSSSTSPSKSAPMSPNVPLPSLASPKLLRSASTAAATLTISPSEISSSFVSASAIGCSNNSNLLMTTSLSEFQQQRYEPAAFVSDAAAMTTKMVSSHPSESNKFNTIEMQQQQQQQQETTIITNLLQSNSTVETQEFDDSKLKEAETSTPLTSSSDIKLLSPSSLCSSLLANTESGKSSKIETPHGSDSRHTSQVLFGSSSDSILKPKITVYETPTRTYAKNNTSDLSIIIGSRRLYGTNPGDSHSPTLSAMPKVDAENIEMDATPTNVPGFVHMQLQRDSDESKIDSDDALSRLSADAVNFLQQQQQQYSAMTNSTFTAAPTSLVTMAPALNNLSCLHSSLVALTDGAPTTCSSTESQRTSAKLISDFLQQHLGLKQQYAALSSVCPEHAEYKESDCKNCEMHQLKSSPYHNPSHQHVVTSTNTTPQRSPTRSNSNYTNTIIQSPANLTTAPNITAVNVSAAGVAVAAAACQQQNAAAAVAVAAAAAAAAAASVTSNTSSFTIGACSDHINGRPLGVECTRCEIILNSTRLNTGVQMSTRNSCKTLKCPQCNWHYKYQETLEIHMREKHPDGESACGYCLSAKDMKYCSSFAYHEQKVHNENHQDRTTTEYSSHAPGCSDTGSYDV